MATLGPVLRIVVAEDEAVIRLDLVEALREAGYDVLAAVGDGETALAKIDELRPDVTVVDIAMPGMDGLEVTRRAADRTAIVVLTAFGQRDLIERATQAGAMGYLVKPIGPENLVPAIEIAAARWVAAHELQAEATDLARRLAERQHIDRAKGLLMAQGLTEEEAFAALRQRAMDARTTMGRVAQNMITEQL